MTRDDAQIKIRLPLPLKTKIAAAAQAASRSLNAEVVARLQHSLETESYSAINREEIRALIIQVLDERERAAAKVSQKK